MASAGVLSARRRGLVPRRRGRPLVCPKGRTGGGGRFAKASRLHNRRLAQQSTLAPGSVVSLSLSLSPARAPIRSDEECHDVRASSPHPPPGGENPRTGHLPRWRGRRTQCPKGRAAIGQAPRGAESGLARPDPQERCQALVRIGTRKHRSPSPRALRQANQTMRTGRAAKARVASCDLKGGGLHTNRKRPSPSRWGRRQNSGPKSTPQTFPNLGEELKERGRPETPLPDAAVRRSAADREAQHQAVVGHFAEVVVAAGVGAIKAQGRVHRAEIAVHRH